MNTAPMGYAITKTIAMMTPWALDLLLLLLLPFSVTAPSDTEPDPDPDPELEPELELVKGFPLELKLAEAKLTVKTWSESCSVMVSDLLVEARLSPDFQAPIHELEPERSSEEQSPHRILAVISLPLTPDPESSSTALLSSYWGMTWPLPVLVLKVTLPLPSW